MFKVNNKDTRQHLKAAIKNENKVFRRHPSVLIFYFEQIKPS